MNNPSVIRLWLISYLLWESTETTPPAGRMSRTGVLQRELRGLKPRDPTQHYAPERVMAFQTEGHQLTTCLQIWRSLEGHVVWPEGIRNYSLSYSQAWTVIGILKNTEREFKPKRLRLTKASEPPRPAPNRCQVQSVLPFCRSSSSRLDWLPSTNFTTTLVIKIVFKSIFKNYCN